jgi:hypothetical protein
MQASALIVKSRVFNLVASAVLFVLVLQIAFYPIGVALGRYPSLSDWDGNHGPLCCGTTEKFLFYASFSLFLPFALVSIWAVLKNRRSILQVALVSGYSLLLCVLGVWVFVYRGMLYE